MLVSAGLAKVVEKKGTQPTSKFYDDLLQAQSEAQKKQLGLWTQDSKIIQKNTREVTYFSEANYNPHKILEEAQKIDRPLESIIEYVFNASFVSVYIHKFQTVIKLSMIHLFTPANMDKDILSEGKAFVEKYILHRTVGVKLERVEEGGSISGRVFHPQGEIAFEILKNGFSKINVPKNHEFDPDYYK